MIQAATRSQPCGVSCDKKILLVLDNCEHVIESASVLANGRQRAPQAHILATSAKRSASNVNASTVVFT